MVKGVAAITGGASGIGEAAARKLADKGHPIAVIDIDQTRSEAVAAEISKHGTTARSYVCDVADARAVDEVAARVESEMGAVDVLVTAAGLLHSKDTLLDIDLAAHDRLWRVNYHGTVHACRSFGRRMSARRRGAIVTVGSINSLVALPLPAYGPSKAAIMRLTEILAVELGRHGIRVNSIGPTYTLTPALKAKIDAGERDVEAIKRVHALDMLVEPSHVADAVAFLCSEEAAAITGILLPVDAGYLAAVTYRTYAGGVPW
jgi:NAD(P)-dependent dehydrogenase (short-subunit alcohol dehydrogenase family)